MNEQAKNAPRSNSATILLILACLGMHAITCAVGYSVGFHTQEMDARAAEREYLRGRKEGSDAVLAAVKKLVDEGKLRYTP